MMILLLTQNHSREWSVPTGTTAGSGWLRQVPVPQTHCCGFGLVATPNTRGKTVEQSLYMDVCARIYNELILTLRRLKLTNKPMHEQSRLLISIQRQKFKILLPTFWALLSVLTLCQVWLRLVENCRRSSDLNKLLKNDKVVCFFPHKAKIQNSASNNFCPSMGSNFVPSLIKIGWEL